MAKSLWIGLRDANQRFSWVMRAVKAGQDVILTDRGKAIAVIKRLSRVPGPDRVIRELYSRSLVVGHESACMTLP